MGNLCVWEREKGGGGEIGSREGVYTSIREGVSEIVNVIVSERKWETINESSRELETDKPCESEWK